MVTVRNTTITGNSASTSGGGLYFNVAQLLQNSIVWANKAADSVDAFGTLADGSAGNLVGEDPKFKDAANGDYHLPFDLPAVGIGMWYEGIGKDLDGRNRIRKIDAGCYKIERGLLFLIK